MQICLCVDLETTGYNASSHTCAVAWGTSRGSVRFRFYVINESNKHNLWRSGHL